MSSAHADILKMLKALIGTASISSTHAHQDLSNLPVIEQLHPWLEALGFEVEVMPVPGHPGKYNLIASLGQGPGGLVLAGHTDTVPCNPELWNSDPFQLTERDNRFYGLGTCDMKGFFALAIAAAARCHQQPFKQPLIILATADEETSMSGARALVAAGRPLARAAVIGEPTGLKPIRMHKGMMMEAVRIEGRSGHSSDPSLGANALDAMHGVLSELIQFRQELASKYQNTDFRVSVPTLNLGCIHGGDNPNRICGRCELEFDLRPLPGMSLEGLREAVHQRLDPLAEQFGVQLETFSLFPGIPPFATPADSELTLTLERLTGHRAEAVAFGTEAPFLQQLGMDTLILGPGSINQAHQPDEYLDQAQIQPCVDLLEKLIIHYCLTPART